MLDIGFYLLATRPKMREYSGLVQGSEPKLTALERRKHEVEKREQYYGSLVKAEEDLRHLREDVLATREQRLVEVQQELEALCGQFRIDFNSVTFDHDLLENENLDKLIMFVPFFTQI